MASFGPQMIGATEKALDALLRHVLADSSLTQSQWVALRLAGQNRAGAPLPQLLRERAYLTDAGAVVAELAERGLLERDTLTSAGGELVAELQARIASLTGDIWAQLSPDDVAATERVLTKVTARVQGVLGELGASA